MSDGTSNLVSKLRSPANVFYEYAADGGALLREAADEIDRLTADNKVLREALVGAVDCIREWHNMGVPQKERSQLWDIYWRNAPEMKAIRAALEGVKP